MSVSYFAQQHRGGIGFPHHRHASSQQQQPAALQQQQCIRRSNAGPITRVLHRSQQASHSHTRPIIRSTTSTTASNSIGCHPNGTNDKSGDIAPQHSAHPAPGFRHNLSEAPLHSIFPMHSENYEMSQLSHESGSFNASSQGTFPESLPLSQFSQSSASNSNGGISPKNQILGHSLCTSKAKIQGRNYAYKALGWENNNVASTVPILHQNSQQRLAHEHLKGSAFSGSYSSKQKSHRAESYRLPPVQMHQPPWGEASAVNAYHNGLCQSRTSTTSVHGCNSVAGDLSQNSLPLISTAPLDAAKVWNRLGSSHPMDSLDMRSLQTLVDNSVNNHFHKLWKTKEEEIKGLKRLVNQSFSATEKDRQESKVLIEQALVDGLKEINMTITDGQTGLQNTISNGKEEINEKLDSMEVKEKVFKVQVDNAHQRHQKSMSIFMKLNDEIHESVRQVKTMYAKITNMYQFAEKFGETLNARIKKGLSTAVDLVSDASTLESQSMSKPMDTKLRRSISTFSDSSHKVERMTVGTKSSSTKAKHKETRTPLACLKHTMLDNASNLSDPSISTECKIRSTSIKTCHASPTSTVRSLVTPHGKGCASPYPRQPIETSRPVKSKRTHQHIRETKRGRFCRVSASKASTVFDSDEEFSFLSSN